MKCNWRRWLWGLIPVVMLSWVAVQAERPRIEQELSEAASAQVLRSGASWAHVTFQGRDAVLAGRAWAENDLEATTDLVRKLPGVRVVENKASLIDKADTYTWSVSRRNHRIRLAGFVPNTATRREILGVTKANFPGYEVVDRMTLMRGVPAADTWLGGVSFALTQLAAMRRGEARLNDLTLSISGQAEDASALRAIRAAASKAPKGIKINLDQLTAPVVTPYVWTAQFSDGRFDLAGYFPDDAAHGDLTAAAKAVARDGAVADRMQPGGGAPTDWSPAVRAAVRALAKLESGSAELKDATLLVSGVSIDAATAEAARNLLRGLPPSIKLTEQIRPREASKPVIEEPPRALQPIEPRAKSETPIQPEAKVEAPVAPKVEAPVAPKVEAPVAPKPEAPVTPKVEAPVAPKAAEAAPRIETKAEIEAKSCQATLVELTKAGLILFERASAELDGASSTTLAKVAAAMKSCPEVIVQIEGHTDLEGTSENNHALSLRRAQSVLDYLVRAGVNTRQLEPVGYGETRPVASNDTSESRARNRRIEFVVRPK